jgi:uncharacterized membrane protein YedE/YeeE
VTTAPLIASLIGFELPSPKMPASWSVVIVAGLLVGFGSRLGGGCTSGHGICGVARLSARSITATAIFMAAAIVVVALEIMVLGASCVSPRPQLKREQSPKPEFGWIPANLCDLSKG